ncbi:MAG: (2Fe-2S) ferredoxin domain-containing protein [Nitrospirota bacterium]
MAKPKYHVLVCTNTRPPGTPKGSCGERGAAEVAGRFFELVQTQGLFMDVIVSGTTCLGPCTMGPTVVVYPDAVWYGGVKPSDVDEIVESHIKNGKHVERLKFPDEIWGA